MDADDSGRARVHAFVPGLMSYRSIVLVAHDSMGTMTPLKGP